MRWIFFDSLPWDYDVAAPLVQPIGGSQSALCYLATALARRGHDVTTVTDIAAPRKVNGVRCQTRHGTSIDEFAAPGTITVVLNGPAEIGAQLRRSLSRPPRLVLWTQHAPDQPGVRGLADPECRAAWDRIVCVSDWQRSVICEQLGVSREQTDVLRNAIAPAFEHRFGDADSLARAKSPVLRLAYTSTPFRGLDVLVNCFPRIRERHPACRLDVYSSLSVYGDWPQHDEFQPLYAQCRATEGIEYRGSLPQPELAKELAGVSVLAYPNTFSETSCIAVMEALAAGAKVVTSDLAALPETCQGWATLVPPIGRARSREQFELEFTEAVSRALNAAQTEAPHFLAKRFGQVQAITSTCTWDLRAAEWEAAADRWIGQRPVWQRTSASLLHVQELLRRGKAGAAEIFCQELLQVAPQSADVWFALGAVCLARNALPEAESALRQAIALAPQNAAAWSELSVSLMRQGQSSEAEASARQAVALDATRAAHWVNLANAHFAQHHWAGAVAAYRQALARDPQNPAAWNNLAAAEQRLSNLAAAQEAYERSLALAPNHLGAQANYACLLFERGEQTRAVNLLQDALDRAPASVEALLLLGYAFMRLGELERAKAAYRRAVDLAPNHREARYNLALVLQQTWSLAEAETLIRQVLADDPAYADAWALLSGLDQSQCRQDEARSALERSVELSPNPMRHSRLLHNLQYANEADPAKLLAAHREFDAAYARRLRPASAPPVARRTGDRPLRLGFVSADFRQHPTGFLVLPALEHFDKGRCWVACYAEQLHEDQYTARFRAVADAWRTTVDLAPEEIAARIREDEIDILVDLMGHTGKSQLLVFAHKPSPVQITWFGYVGTTGLAAMDYLLADRFHVRPGEEGNYVEAVLRMPNGYACYQAPADVPKVAPLPALTAGHITFGCFNSPAKFSQGTFDAWAAILRAVPTSRLLLKYGALGESHVQAWIGKQFTERGVNLHRILMEGWSDHHELLATYAKVDLALDTQPYSGGLTTCEALWMGVPVITYPGATFASRHSVSHLSNAGFEQFVAKDRASYIDMAVQWAGRWDQLASIRAEMRDRVSQSPLCDAKTFGHDLLSILEYAWHSSRSPSPLG